jgi:GxxExxY protein
MEKIENKISGIILDTCIHIHRKLGPGLLESIYEEILFYELKNRKLNVKHQKAISVTWDDLRMDLGFRADLIVQSKVLIELKSIERLAPVHFKQTLTYLKLTNLRLGLLINFNEKLIKDGFNRIANNL